MGIHTGTPLLTDEGYTGADVHRAPRIAACGRTHGIQFCLGPHLARGETQIAIGAPLVRCRRIEIDEPEPTLRDDVWMRGVNGLPVRYQPA